MEVESRRGKGLELRARKRCYDVDHGAFPLRVFPPRAILRIESIKTHHKLYAEVTPSTLTDPQQSMVLVWS